MSLSGMCKIICTVRQTFADKGGLMVVAPPSRLRQWLEWVLAAAVVRAQGEKTCMWWRMLVS